MSQFNYKRMRLILVSFTWGAIRSLLNIMRTRICIFPVLLLFLLTSCVEKDDCGIKINTFEFKDLNTTSTISLSQLGITDIQYIPLATDGNCLISSIRRVKFGTKSIFIQNGLENIYKYSIDGNYITKIGIKGKGPGEYIFLRYFTLNSDNQNVYILGAIKEKIFIYSKTGKFIKSIQSPVNTDIIGCIDKKILCYNYNDIGSQKNSFHVLDYEGNILKSFKNKFPYKINKVKHWFLHECLFAGNKGQLFVKEILSDTIFQYKNFSFKPSFILNFGQNGLMITDRENINNSADFLKISYEKTRQQNLLFFRDKVLFVFLFKNELLGTITSTKDGSSQLINISKGFINDFDGGPNLWFQTTKDENTLVSWISAFELKAHVTSAAFKSSTPKYPEKKKELEKLANSLKEDDNPVLMLVKLKE